MFGSNDANVCVFNRNIKARRPLTVCIHDTINNVRKLYVKLLK